MIGDGLFRPSTMDKHNETLRRFQELFNNTEPKNVVMCVWAENIYLNDGIIILVAENRYGHYPYIIFDWECRDDWEPQENCKFKYNTLAQFERKFELKKSIELSIQCDKNQRCFAVAWHVDFHSPHDVYRKTDYLWRERGEMRETDKFVVYSYSKMTEFKEKMKKALEKNIRSYRVFMEDD